MPAVYDRMGPSVGRVSVARGGGVYGRMVNSGGGEGRIEAGQPVVMVRVLVGITHSLVGHTGQGVCTVTVGVEGQQSVLFDVMSGISTQVQAGSVGDKFERGEKETHLQGTAVVVSIMYIGHMIPGGVRHFLTAHVADAACTVLVKQLRCRARHDMGSSASGPRAVGSRSREARLHRGGR